MREAKSPKVKAKRKAQIHNVKDLLATGFFEGEPITYKSKRGELHGFIKGDGYQCGCSQCNYTKVLSACEFERHAGGHSSNQNNHIYLDSGRTLYAVVKHLEEAAPTMLHKEMQAMTGRLISSEDYMAWRNESSDLTNHEVPTEGNGITNGKAQAKSSSHLLSKLVSQGSAMDVSSSLDLSDNGLTMPATGGSSNPASSIRGNGCSVGEATEVSYNPASECVIFSSQESATEDTYDYSSNSNNNIGIPVPDTEGRCDPYSSSKHDVNFMMNTADEIGNTGSSMSICGSPTKWNCCSMESKIESCKEPAAEATVDPTSFSVNLSSPSVSIGSELSMHLSSVTLESNSLLTKSERKRRSPGSPECVGNVLQHKGAAQVGRKKRTDDLHGALFKETILADGCKLSYRSHKEEVLIGYKSGNGILCTCCKEVISPSKFEAHAGFGRRRQPYHNIYTSDDISLHELAFSMARHETVTSVCTNCGAGGKLVACNGCLRTFHTDCLSLPYILDDDGEWYCSHCKVELSSRTAPKLMSPTAVRSSNLRLRRIIKQSDNGGCYLCKESDFSFHKFDEKTIMLCGQCEKEYHVGCLKKHGICNLEKVPNPWNSWLCSEDCYKVQASLQNIVQNGPDAFKSSLQKKIQERGLGDGDDVRFQLFSGKYKNSANKLFFPKATIIFQDAFDAIVEGDQDLIPTMVRGKSLDGQYFEGMFCAILTVKSVIVSAGLFRVFGRDIAELPLVVTAKEYHRKGYFQILFSMIELMLSRMNVSILILPADQNAQSMWIDKFGFVRMEEDKLKKYAKEHPILTFDDTTILEKALPVWEDAMHADV